MSEQAKESKPKRITLVISSLEAGGAERAACLMADDWASQGWKVTLLTLTQCDTDFYKLNSSVQRIGLGLRAESRRIFQAVSANSRRVRHLRLAIRHSRPDFVVSFMGTINILTLLATRGIKVPVVVIEQVDPRQHPIGRVWEKLRRVIYPHADALVVLTERIRPWAESFILASRVHVIPNPARPESDLKAYDPGPIKRSEHRTVIAMGRLTRQKGFDILLRAFAECAKVHSNWRLVVLGEGEGRAELEALAKELSIEDRLSMPGRLKEPASALLASDLFVMSSRFEGLPLALLEAMACGLPVISTDCPTGPKEVIRHEIDGLLVPCEDVPALAEAMSSLMSNEQWRKRLAERAPEVHERFGIRRIMAQWDSLLMQLESRKPSHRYGNGIK